MNPQLRLVSKLGSRATLFRFTNQLTYFLITKLLLKEVYNILTAKNYRLEEIPSFVFNCIQWW